MRKEIYDKINDYELLYLAKEDNEEATNILLEKYKCFINKKVYTYCKRNSLYYYDYLNEAYFIFYKAIETFNEKTVFTKYLEVCLDNSLKNCLKKDKINRELSNIDNYDVNNYLINYMSTEELFIQNEDFENTKNKIANNLSWNENIIFNLRIEGYCLNEISEILDINIKRVYNAINRIKNKINKIV